MRWRRRGFRAALSCLLILTDLGGSDRYKIVYNRFGDLGYHRHMAVIHISRTEAASDFDALISRAGQGDEILIESNAGVIARLLPGGPPRPRLLSESLRILKERGSTVTLDPEFGRDLEEVINSHSEPLNPPAWD